MTWYDITYVTSAVIGPEKAYIKISPVWIDNIK